MHPSLQMGFTGACRNGLDRSGDVCRTLPGRLYAAPTPQQYFTMQQRQRLERSRLFLELQNPICREGLGPSLQMGFTGVLVGNGLDRSGDVCRTPPGRLYAAPTPQQYFFTMQQRQTSRNGQDRHWNPICREGPDPSLQMGFTGAL